MAALASFDVLSPATVAGEPPRDAPACAFCGFRDAVAARVVVRQRQGEAATRQIACLVCASVQELSRPAIDHEALIVWMPEISQAALNRLVRGLHVSACRADRPVALRELAEADTGPSPALYRALHARRRAAAARIGTTSPSLLERAVSLLSADAVLPREQGETGLRLLHLGRHFVDGRDIYPDVVRRWAAEPGAAP